MSFTLHASRSLRAVVAAALVLPAGSATALEFDIFGTQLRVDNLVTIGATFRMQDIDPTLIGKSNLNPGLCLVRDNVNGQTTDSGPSQDQDENQFSAGRIPRNCTTSSPLGAPPTTISPDNVAFVNAPGSFSSAGDDGDLQFEKGDLVHAVLKYTSDISFSVYDFGFFIRPVVFFDQVYNSHKLTFPDTTLIAREVEYDDRQKEVNAYSWDILDAHVGRAFDVLDRSISVKLGKQVLNWGESSLLLFNSLNTINPPDARRLRQPGLDLKEVLQPVGMLTVNGDIIENVSLEMFYQYEWTGVQFDPVGAFQSPADILGMGFNGDQRYALLGFGKPPEDPYGLWRPIDTCSAPISCADAFGLLGSSASRTVFVDERKPDDQGQYGFALRTFLPDFNNGTELAFYFANYHSRLPVVSARAADATCFGDLGALSAATFAADCGYLGPGQAAINEPAPVDTMRFLIEYPENIKVYGISFNTTIGDYALSGEYAYRPALPTQIHLTDLGFAGLQPALPAQDIPIPAPSLGIPVPTAVVTIPGRRSAFPSFLTQYRGLACTDGTDCVQPGSYVRGYEEMKTGQLNLTVLRLIGGDNPIGASQMSFLLETGLNHVLDFPELSELQFHGGGVNTHISGGADGTEGYEPAAVDGNAGHPDNGSAYGLRQNPTTHKDHDGFGSEYSYGYRLLNLNRWDDAVFGANLESLIIIRHDVGGTTPGIGTNFVQGRKEFNLGGRFDYLSEWFGEVRYTWFTGGGFRDASRDKDNIFVTVGYQF